MKSISVITVSYNSELTIRDTIESVLSQTRTGFEYIIIDGASKDSTLQIIKSYKELFENKGIDYNWISEPDQGIYDAMNKGVRLSKGNVVSFINSDDWYGKDTIDSVLKVFESIEEVDLVYGNMTMIKEDGKGSVLKTPKPLSMLFKEQSLYFPSVFIGRHILENKQPPFDLNYRLASDYRFLLKNFLDGRKFYFLGENLSFYRLGGSTTQQIRKSWKEVENIQIEFGRNRFLAKLNYYEKIVKRKILKAINRL